jgi:hypothetical protein
VRRFLKITRREPTCGGDGQNKPASVCYMLYFVKAQELSLPGCGKPAASLWEKVAAPGPPDIFKVG